ncbi:MAG: NAD(P) transhydrogenase subunit alpha [Thermaerobacter sp.]|nr:NAD(P) transhydrogenase subunit alpha [Thermaerobacter sp.]
MHANLLQELFSFVLAVFVGWSLITKIPPVLHTPLMSATNAIHGVLVVGSLIVIVAAVGTSQLIVAALAVLLATLNVVGGFVVTDRMLEMFRKSPNEKGQAAK